MKAKITHFILGLVLAVCIGCANTVSTTDKVLQLVSPSHYKNSDKEQWNKFNSQIISTDANTILIQWEGLGGYNSIGDTTINAMETAKRQGKTIILRLTGDAISMHANVACHASKIIWNGNLLIFHSGFFGHNKNGSKKYTTDRHYFDYCVARGPLKGILTDSDIDDIIRSKHRVEVSPTHHMTLPDYP